jgi:hypothetical protein
MRRLARSAGALLCLLLAIPAAAGAGLPRGGLPALFARQIHAINRAPHAPAVLLPRSMPLDAKHLYASGGPSGSSYNLEIGAVAPCGGANACFVADFTADQARTVFGKRVTVRGASKAGFVALACGASCSPPQIDFIVHDIRYTIQANLNSSRSDRATLIAAAQDAISAGPR